MDVASTVPAHEPDPRSGLPIGPLVTGPTPPAPGATVLEGRWCRLEPLGVHHADGLHAASTPPDADARFTYLSTDAPVARTTFDEWLRGACASTDRTYQAVIDRASGRVEGRQAFLRIDPANRSVELGDIYWGPTIARSRVSTEAFALCARHVFEELGYRRFEWKCNALNRPSIDAAVRFGFRFEGVFRKSMIVKGRTRDTAWFSIVDDEWPALRAAFDAWLEPDNFDESGAQRTRLGTPRTATPVAPPERPL